MSGFSQQVVKEFCSICSWTFEVWQNHKALFDDNPKQELLKSSKGAAVFARVNTISQEYVLHQIIKLHDPAVMRGNVTLGIEYIIRFGAWDQATLNSLNLLAAKLDAFAKQLRTVRNKILSHNDLEAILNGGELGSFPEGEDVEYFNALQEFVNLVHDYEIGGPYPFPNFVEADVLGLMSVIRP